MFSYKLLISYEGTTYCGWQKNRDQPTIQLALEKALQTIRLPILRLEGASRTDCGVHALGQVARMDLTKEIKNLRLTLVGINSQLPEDIRVMHLEPCDSSFHPTLHATCKTYEYFLCTGPAQSPLHRHFSWHIPKSLDIERMRNAAAHLVGTHDFEALTNTKKLETYEHYVRTLFEISITELESSRFKILVRGNHFLYKMVRNLVGLLVAVGKREVEAESVLSIVASKDRRLAPMTAPAHGLVLTRIDYD